MCCSLSPEQLNAVASQFTDVQDVVAVNMECTNHVKLAHFTAIFTKRADELSSSIKHTNAVVTRTHIHIVEAVNGNRSR